jgi:hypothetical protein
LVGACRFTPGRGNIRWHAGPRSQERRVGKECAVFAVGRLAFWLSYRRGATARAFGFGTTFYPTVFAYGLALILFFMQAF